MWDIVAFLIIGLLAGWLAGALVRGHSFGIAGNVLVGIVGAFLGGLVFNALDIHTPYGFWGSLASATAGAILLLFVASLFGRVSRPTHHPRH